MGNKILVIFSLILGISAAHASEDIRSYDQIVRELSGSQLSTSNPGSRLRLESLRFHASVGAVTSLASFESGYGIPSSKNMQGAELVLGIDLFTRDWLAEGAVRTYSRQSFMETDVSLREFDLRLVHEHTMSAKSQIRAGAGIATRFLTFGTSPAEGVSSKQTTPAMLALLGYKFNIVENMAISADISYRSSFVDDTIDDGSIDAGLRVGGSF